MTRWLVGALAVVAFVALQESVAVELPDGGGWLLLGLLGAVQFGAHAALAPATVIPAGPRLQACGDRAPRTYRTHDARPGGVSQLARCRPERAPPRIA
jgi:hypothetical protein